MSELVERLKQMVEDNDGACFDDLIYDENAIKKAILLLEKKENERKQGALEELENIFDFFKKERFSIIFTDKLKNKLEERLTELKEVKK